MRSLVLLTLLTVVVACRPPPPEQCRPSGGFLLPSANGFGIAGANLRITLRLAMVCPPEIVPTANMSVLDPMGGSLSHPDPEVVSAGGEGFTATVTVLTTRAGRYHAVARFEPNLGLVQEDVAVAEDLRDAGPALVIADAGAALLQCRQIDLSEGGHVLCLSDPARMFTREGQALEGLPGPAVREGVVFWVAESSGAVSRWLERADGGFEMSPLNMSVTPEGGAVGVLAPGVDEAVQLSQSGTLRHLRHRDGGLFVERSEQLTAYAPLTLWRAGDEYISISNVYFCTGDSDGGVCTQFPPVFSTRPDPAGNEPQGLWVGFDDATVFPALRTLAHLGPRGEQATLPLPLGWSTPVDAGVVPWDTGARLMRDGGQTMLVRASAGTLTLQRYPDLPLISVTSRWAAFRGPGGSVLIYAR